MLKNLMLGCSLLALSVGGLSAVPGDANEARVGVAQRKKASGLLPQPIEENLLGHLPPSQSFELEGLFADSHVDYEGFHASYNAYLGRISRDPDIAEKRRVWGTFDAELKNMQNKKFAFVLMSYLEMMMFDRDANITLVTNYPDVETQIVGTVVQYISGKIDLYPNNEDMQLDENDLTNLINRQSLDILFKLPADKFSEEVNFLNRSSQPDVLRQISFQNKVKFLYESAALRDSMHQSIKLPRKNENFYHDIFVIMSRMSSSDREGWMHALNNAVNFLETNPGPELEGSQIAKFMPILVRLNADGLMRFPVIFGSELGDYFRNLDMEPLVVSAFKNLLSSVSLLSEDELREKITRFSQMKDFFSNGSIHDHAKINVLAKALQAPLDRYKIMIGYLNAVIHSSVFKDTDFITQEKFLSSGIESIGDGANINISSKDLSQLSDLLSGMGMATKTRVEFIKNAVVSKPLPIPFRKQNFALEKAKDYVDGMDDNEKVKVLNIFAGLSPDQASQFDAYLKELKALKLFEKMTPMGKVRFLEESAKIPDDVRMSILSDFAPLNRDLMESGVSDFDRLGVFESVNKLDPDGFKEWASAFERVKDDINLKGVRQGKAAVIETALQLTPQELVDRAQNIKYLNNFKWRNMSPRNKLLGHDHVLLSSSLKVPSEKFQQRFERLTREYDKNLQSFIREKTNIIIKENLEKD